MNKNTKIIKLHSADDNSVMSFNSEFILYVNIQTYEDHGDFTTIGLVGSEEEYAVNESVDKIYNKLKDNGFVRVHKEENNSIELFNIRNFIMCGIDSDNTSFIKLSDGIEMAVNETPEKVTNMIIDAKKVLFFNDMNLQPEKLPSRGT